MVEAVRPPLVLCYHCWANGSGMKHMFQETADARTLDRKQCLVV